MRRKLLWLVVLVFLSVIGWFVVVHTPNQRCSVANWSCRTIRFMGTQLSNYPVTSVASVSLLQTTSSGQLNGSNLSVSPHSTVVNDSAIRTDTQSGRTLGSLALGKDTTEHNSSQLHQLKTAVEEQNRSQGSSFEIHDPFHLPQPVVTKSAEELLQTEWMRELKEFLKGVQSPDPIALVTSDYNYREVLLNWIVKATIAVDPPVNNIMVLSLDLDLYELLKSRAVACIYVEPSSFLNPTAKSNRHTPFSEAMIIRLTVMRFISHWGFDVVNYDSDALIIKNPGPIFEQHKEADIIGSSGEFPQEIRDKWGITLCMGVIMIRSSPQTELFWEIFANSVPNVINDQIKLNIALYTLGLRFKEHGIQDQRSIKTEVWEAEGRDGLFVVVLPTAVVCRHSCKLSQNGQLHYYIWHKGGKQESKVKYVAQAGLWHLSKNWEQITNNTTATGVLWLKEISTY